MSTSLSVGSAAPETEAPRAEAGGGFTLSLPGAALRLGLVLGLIALFIVAATAELVDGLPEADWAFGIIAITSLDYRGNIANWALTSLLLACAVQLATLSILRRDAAGRPAAYCAILAGLALLASLVGFTDFSDRLDLWQSAAETVDAVIFWSLMLAVALLLPPLFGESRRAPVWLKLTGTAVVLCLLSLLLDLDSAERLAFRIWYDLGGSESGAETATDLLGLCGMMLRLAVAAVLFSVLLERLCRVAARLRIDARRWS